MRFRSTPTRFRTPFAFLAPLIAVFALACVGNAMAAPPGPAFDVQALASPTNFKPDTAGLNSYEVLITNSGGATTEHGPEDAIKIVDTLPEGVNVEKARLFGPRNTGVDILETKGGKDACAIDTVNAISTVTCEVTDSLLPGFEPAKLFPGNELRLTIRVSVPGCPGGEESCPLTNEIEVSGGGAATVTEQMHHEMSSTGASAGFTEFRSEMTGPDGLPDRAAASHPYQYVTTFAINTGLAPPDAENPIVPAEGDIKEIEVALPPGLVGDPTATPRCTSQQFNTSLIGHGDYGPNGSNVSVNECPDDSAVGLIAVWQLEGSGRSLIYPIYNLVPPEGMPAQLGFQVLGLPIYINTRLRSDSDYGITAYLQNSPEAERVSAARVSIWGDPADESHDPVRGSCNEVGGSCPTEEVERAFMRLPSNCASPMTTTMKFNRWPFQDSFIDSAFEEPAPAECDRPPFEPSIEARPTTNVADAPSGLHFNLHLPQAENDDPEGLGHADLRDARVVLPDGFTVNPSSADGLAACSFEQIGYTGAGGGRHNFTAAPARCPDASKVGTVRVETPLLDHPLPGAVYLAAPYENPFGNLITIYIAIHDPESGVVVKLAGRVDPDPRTGRLTTTVEQNPQLPFEDFTFDFFEGARAPLRTPSTCGTHTTTTSLTPWSAPEGATAHPADSFQTTTPAAGQGSCPANAAALPSSPHFEAGTEAPVAGAFSPIVMKLRRGDGSQEFSELSVNPPRGLLARLAGVPYCPDAALAVAASRPGREEQASPSCPGASQVGSVSVGTGAGPAPYYAQGKAYLAGPYRGAPLSLAVVTPAVAGPFDLGTVVVRAALHVDPVTTQITATTDAIPHILQGIPLDVRSVAVRLDHSGWGLNPTSCDPMSFDGQLRSVFGQRASLFNRFQVGGCTTLRFKPKLALSLRGRTKRGGFPAFKAVYRPRPGDANLSDLTLRFPRSEFIEQGHFRTICTRVQWAAGAGGGRECPRGSIYGRVRAYTPLLDQPLTGPVYLRSSSHELPDVVFALRGQVEAEVAVRVDSVKGGLRASLQGAPDVPISAVVLNMQGGKKGLFVNSRDICAHTFRAAVALRAHNGKPLTLRSRLRNRKCKAGGRRR